LRSLVANHIGGHGQFERLHGLCA
jgi:hypothetical protein